MSVSLYPASLNTFLVITAVLASLAVIYNNNINQLKHWLAQCVGMENVWFGSFMDPIAVVFMAALIWSASILLQRFCIRMLLNYHGWLYDDPKRPTLKTIAFKISLDILLRKQIMTNSVQDLLPSQPVPSVKSTVTKYLEGMRPLLDDPEYTKLNEQAADFRNYPAWILQLVLWMKYIISDNYVLSWWDKYIFWGTRWPLLINSSIYAMDTLECLTDVPASRAANLCAALVQFRDLIEQHKLEPIRIRGVPLCTSQYFHVFNTCRIPHAEFDEIISFTKVNHAAVLHKGCWWKLPICNQNGCMTPKEIEFNLQIILESTEFPDNREKMLAALTGNERLPWALYRNKHFNDGLNKESLGVIESAAFVLVFDDDDYTYDLSEADSQQADRFASSLWTGNGQNRWFDKSVNLVISRNGRAGFVGEHGCFDGLCFAHMAEYVFAMDQKYKYTENGHCLGELNRIPDGPMRLKWNIPAEIVEITNQSFVANKQLIDDLDLALLLFDDYGNGLIKYNKISPDAYIQIAMQLAIFRDQGKFVLTTETTVTRLFKKGRTENFNSATAESCNFVRAMLDGDKSKDELLEMLRSAASVHRQHNLDAWSGNGYDCHMFALYIASMTLGMQQPFLEAYRNAPILLSTSQSPQQQTTLWNPDETPQYISAGGGFGPVSQNGYGVSYVVGGSNRISFHITCRRSCTTTNSKRFRGELRKALEDMKELLQKPNKTKP